MSPPQYRALEALREAGAMRLADGPRLVPGRIHPRTAEALARRRLVTLSLDHDGRTRWATITAEGVTLLERTEEADDA